jgi:hypothetical protein
MRKLQFAAAGLLCAMFLMSYSAFAQSDVASISGFVRDSSGAVIPGVKITIKNEAVEFERSVTTNNEGYYFVSTLPPGSIRSRQNTPGSSPMTWCTRNSIPVSRQR